VCKAWPHGPAGYGGGSSRLRAYAHAH